MKLIHIADLHIGKRVNEVNLLADQSHILRQILRVVDEVKPAGILMAGDIYDKSVPAGEAVEILDDFLTELASRDIKLFIVSGNHDSPERLNFGSRIMEQHGVHIAGTYGGSLRKIALDDEFGPVNIYLLPFIKPAMVNPYFPDAVIETYEEAVRAAVKSAEVDRTLRNVLVAHQFMISGEKRPEQSDSETITVGGLDNIDISAFASFDYVALGHLHGPQSIGRETVRYAGSPLKYSFSEAHHHKSVTVLTLSEKGMVDIEAIALSPLRDMIEIKGPIEELVRLGAALPEQSLDYIRAIITNENDIYDAIGQLRQVYPNIMRIDFENSRTRQNLDSKTAASGDITLRSPMALFEEFYLNQNNSEMNSAQRGIMEEIFKRAEGVQE